MLLANLVRVQIVQTHHLPPFILLPPSMHPCPPLPSLHTFQQGLHEGAIPWIAKGAKRLPYGERHTPCKHRAHTVFLFYLDDLPNTIVLFVVAPQGARLLR